MLTCCASQDRSLLHAAVSSGKTDIVQYLLSKGATPNTSDDEVIVWLIPYYRPRALHPGMAPSHLGIHRRLMLRVQETGFTEVESQI